MVHAPVLATEEPIAAERLPPPGPLALVPMDAGLGKQAGQRYVNALSKTFAKLEIQQGVQEVNEQTRVLIWLDPSGNSIEALDRLLAQYKQIGWIQLPMAGITHYMPVVQKYGDRFWTSCKGAFSQPVAEHALMLTLALLRYVPMRVHATSWGPTKEATLFNANVVILGAGGITLSLLSLMAPFTPTVTVLRRKAEPIEPAFVPDALKDKIDVGTLADLDTYLPKADVVIVNCALTPETRHALAKRQFDQMKSNAIVVNVARGEVVHTDDLVDALKHGKIFGAGLDVTHPEPLPDNHPLWNLSSSHPELDAPAEKGGKRANLIITPHCANTSITSEPLYEERFLRNVKAWMQKTGKFEGVVDPKLGY